MTSWLRWPCATPTSRREATPGPCSPPSRTTAYTSCSLSGRCITGIDSARRYYDHFFNSFRPLVAGYALRSEWVEDAGVGQEYTIWTRSGAGGALERHEVIGILTFGGRLLSGERAYGSERLLRLMFGPLYDEAVPTPVGVPPPS